MANVLIMGRVESGDAISNIDAHYGPYESPQAAQEFLEEERLITPGLTVEIQEYEGGPIVEYWWQGGTTINHLVPKHDSNAIYWE